jgi:hypothetical protein
MAGDVVRRCSNGEAGCTRPCCRFVDLTQAALAHIARADDDLELAAQDLNIVAVVLQQCIIGSTVVIC